MRIFRFNGLNGYDSTLPKTNSSHLKIGFPQRKQSYSNHPFSGVNSLLVSGRVNGDDLPFYIYRFKSKSKSEICGPTWPWMIFLSHPEVLYITMALKKTSNFGALDVPSAGFHWGLTYNTLFGQNIHTKSQVLILWICWKNVWNCLENSSKNIQKFQEVNS